jgi:DNA replication protein DnaC
VAKVDEWSLKRMNIPERLWNSTYTEMPEALHQPVRNYIGKLPEMLRMGTGFYLHGPSGVGKTSGAVVILKSACERDRWGYYTTVKDLRQAIREEWTFDGEASVLARCKEVDILVLDDLALDDFKNFTFGIGEVEHLVASRAVRSKTTILTTRLTPDVFRAEYPALLQTMQGNFVSISCNGINLKEQAAEKLRRELGVR